MNIIVEVDDNGKVISMNDNFDDKYALEMLKQNNMFLVKADNSPNFEDEYGNALFVRDGVFVFDKDIEQENSNEPYQPTNAEEDHTISDIINAEILLNQADIIAKQNEHDEVLAEILLNQMGV